MGKEKLKNNSELDNNPELKKQAKLIGIRIKHKRKEKELTQEKLSEQMDISLGQLSCIERGVYLPTTINLFKICKILGEDPNYYLYGYISEKRNNKITELFKLLPENYQDMAEKSLELLVNAYIEELTDLTNK